jgi:hypothetical protein
MVRSHLSFGRRHREEEHCEQREQASRVVIRCCGKRTEGALTLYVRTVNATVPVDPAVLVGMTAPEPHLNPPTLDPRKVSGAELYPRQCPSTASDGHCSTLSFLVR